MPGVAAKVRLAVVGRCVGCLQVAVEGAVEEGLEEGFQAAAAGGLGDFHLADFAHPLGDSC